MKKILAIVLAAVMIFAASSTAFAADITLDQIVDGFNNYPTVKQYAEFGSVWKASKTANGIHVDVKAGSETYGFDYTLNGNILSIEIPGTDSNSFAAAFGTMFIIDVVETMLGYPQGEYIDMMNAVDTSEFTVEKDGIEIRQTADNGFAAKIDISKPATKVDLSDVYVSRDQYEDSKYFTGDGSVSINKGYISFYKEGWDGENTIFIGEKGGLTNRAYKTLLDVIAVLKGDDAAAAYAKQYADIKSAGNADGIFIFREGFEDDFGFFPEEGYEYIKLMDYEEQIPADNEPDEASNQEDLTGTVTSKNSAPFIIGCVIVIVVAAAAVILAKRKKS